LSLLIRSHTFKLSNLSDWVTVNHNLSQNLS
jgi:hypothetical protein